MYWLKFYEEGVFCSAIGQPHETHNEAIMHLASLALQMQKQGFKCTLDAESFVYDRYGTRCSVRIEEV